ncbi:MAG TPA: GNAT family N-acetyltransferase [Pseudonocardiaceae bacterium]
MVEVAAGLTVWRTRRAEVADVASLGRINVAAWRAAYVGIVPDEYLANLDAGDRAERWRGILTTPGPHAVFVAVDEQDAVAAYCGVGQGRTVDGKAEPGAGELYSIYADPAHQGTGAGRVVHDAGVEYLRQQGYRWAGLWVFTANARARAWYAARGWVPDGTTHIDEIEGVTIPEMRYARTFSNG